MYVVLMSNQEVRKTLIIEVKKNKNKRSEKFMLLPFVFGLGLPTVEKLQLGIKQTLFHKT